MHFTRLIVAIALLASPIPFATAAGQPRQQLLQVSSNEVGMLTYQVSKPVYYDEQFTYTVMVPYTITKEVVVDGQTQTVAETQYKPETKTATRKVCKFVSELVCRPVDLKATKAFETNGQPIPSAVLARRCADPTLVVVSADDQMIPEYFASVFKPGTVILALPPEPKPMPMMTPSVMPQPAPAPIISAPVAVDAAPQPAAPPAAPIPAPVVAPAPTVAAPTPGIAAAEPVAPPLPFTQQPEFVFLSRDGGELLKIRQMVEVVQPVEVTFVVGSGSSTIEKTMTVHQSSRRHINTSVPWKAVTASLPVEGELSHGRVKEKLGQGEVVGLISIDGKPVDATWLQNFKPSVLVVSGVRLPVTTEMAPPPPPMMAPVQPMPAPAPPVAPPATP